MTNLSIDEILMDDTSLCIIINSLKIEDPQLYDSLLDLDDEKRIDYLKKSITIGSNVLQMMDTTSRVDYVRGEFEKIKSDFTLEMDKAFSSNGVVSKKFDEFFGTNGALEILLEKHFGEDGSVMYKLLYPNDVSTPLGKFTKQLQDELDPNTEGTAFHQIKTCIVDGFTNLDKELGISSAREEERSKGTLKGRDFQDYIYETLDELARDFEDLVEYVGDDLGPRGKVGDVVIIINPRDTRGIEQRIVIEAKNAAIRMSGKNSFLKELDEAKLNRVSHYAIGTIHESHTPKSVGAYRRYDGNKIICRIPDDMHPISLEVAYKVARGELVSAIMGDKLDIDPIEIVGKISEIEGKVENIRSIKVALSGASKNINSAKDSLDALEKDLRQSLTDLSLMVKPITLI